MLENAIKYIISSERMSVIQNIIISDSFIFISERLCRKLYQDQGIAAGGLGILFFLVFIGFGIFFFLVLRGLGICLQSVSLSAVTWLPILAPHGGEGHTGEGGGFRNWLGGTAANS